MQKSGLVILASLFGALAITCLLLFIAIQIGAIGSQWFVSMSDKKIGVLHVVVPILGTLSALLSYGINRRRIKKSTGVNN